jgi:tetratricopeptide (TPR) repeat protein
MKRALICLLGSLLLPAGAVHPLFAEIAQARQPSPTAAPRSVIARLEGADFNRVLAQIVLRTDGDQRSAASLIARLDTAIAEHDRETAAAAAAFPRDRRVIFERMRLLRSRGREQEALEIAAPFLTDIPSTAGLHPYGGWIVNEAAYSLLASGRPEDAFRLMEELSSLNATRNPHLLANGINYAAMLWEAGRPADALRQLDRLSPVARRFATPGGIMWIASIQTCALHALGEPRAVHRLLIAMQRRRSDNWTALMRARLCTGDLDGAENLLIERLRSDGAAYALVALQDYGLGETATGQLRGLITQLQLLRERPRVRQEIERSGVILRLPLARTYHGTL